MTDGYIDRVFGPDGYLARKFEDANPGIAYEIREGQIDLSRNIHKAFETGKHLIGEGPTGTGKSLAYSVPAVWHALRGRSEIGNTQHDARVIIATGNIALQEQLVKKDLPFLQSVLPRPFTFALLKGRNNFVCRDRFRDNQARGRLPGASLFNSEFDDELIRLTDWIDGNDNQAATTTGDKSDLPFVPKDKNWNYVSVGSNDCKGSDCQFSEECFSVRAKEVASTADIVVTNFHMLFAHVMVKAATEGYAFVLPEFKFLIIDEAHDLVGVARSFFGYDRGPTGIKEMAHALKDWGENEQGIDLQYSTDDFFDAIQAFAQTERYRQKGRLAAGDLTEECDWERFTNAIRSFAIRAEKQLKAQEEVCSNCKGEGSLEATDMYDQRDACQPCNGSGKIRVEPDKSEKKKIRRSTQA